MAAKRARRPKYDQLTFDRHNWGGTRPGAGRKRSRDSGVSHERREALSPHHPAHITTRLIAGLPSLRRRDVFDVLRPIFESGRSREGFRLVHFSVQSTHLHLIVEADNARRLSRGLQSLLIRIARNLNKLWRRKGRVFSDRYHARALRSPRQVRNALCYVLNNARKHGQRFAQGELDPFSSSDTFDGWDYPPHPSARHSSGLVARARTWLLTLGWRRHGPLPVSGSA